MTKKPALNNSEDRLRSALADNRGTYTISKDGYIRLDMKNQKVRESFTRQANQVRSMVTRGKLIFK